MFLLKKFLVAGEITCLQQQYPATKNPLTTKNYDLLHAATGASALCHAFIRPPSHGIVYALHLAVGQRGRGAVLGERLDLLLGIADAFKHLVGVAAEFGARPVGRSVVRQCERAAYGHELAHRTGSLLALLLQDAIIETAPTANTR